MRTRRPSGEPISLQPCNRYPPSLDKLRGFHQGETSVTKHIALASSILLIFAAAPSPAQVATIIDVSKDQLTKAGSDSRNWLHTQGNNAPRRYCPGGQMSTQNGGKLRRALVFPTAVNAYVGADRV